MHVLPETVVVLLAIAANSGLADWNGRSLSKRSPLGGLSRHDGVDLPQHRAKRQVCRDTNLNCAADYVDADGTVLPALYPGGSGCTSFAVEGDDDPYTCGCAETCPNFCADPQCKAADTTTTTTTTATPTTTTSTSTTTTTTTSTTTTTAPATSGLDTSLPDVQNDIVALHNAKRRLIPSPTMLEMSWDSGIAALAQAWANQCTMNPPHPDKITQPQYWSTTKFNKTGQNAAYARPSWSSAIDQWYDEINSCQPGVGSTTGAAVAHYTQIVWNTTYAVGCGYKVCPSWNIFICQYGPPGNVSPRSEDPYLPGPACTGTDTCHNGLRTNPCPYTNWYDQEYCDDQYDEHGSQCARPDGGDCKASCLCKKQGLLY